MKIEEIPANIVEIYKSRGMRAVSDTFYAKIDNQPCGCLVTVLYATDEELRDYNSVCEKIHVLMERSGLEESQFWGLIHGFDNNTLEGEDPAYLDAYEIGKLAYDNLDAAGLVEYNGEDYDKDYGTPD